MLECSTGLSAVDEGPPVSTTAGSPSRSTSPAIDTARSHEVREGDLVCIHDAGAYAASMASNYNSQPFAAEALVEDGRARLVRRRQAIEDLYRLEEDES